MIILCFAPAVISLASLLPLRHYHETRAYFPSIVNDIYSANYRQLATAILRLPRFSRDDFIIVRTELYNKKPLQKGRLIRLIMSPMLRAHSRKVSRRANIFGMAHEDIIISICVFTGRDNTYYYFIVAHTLHL